LAWGPFSLPKCAWHIAELVVSGNIMGQKRNGDMAPLTYNNLKKMIFQSNHLIILNPRHPINPKDKKTQVKKSPPP